MPWPEDPLGPLDPRASRKVGRYLRGSPTPASKACLEDFFKRLREGAVNEEYQQIDDIVLVYACGHLIWFRDNGEWVDEIEPGYY